MTRAPLPGRYGRNRPAGAYPLNWSDLARLVKTAAAWRCERCRHPHETPTDRRRCDRLCRHPRDGKQRVLTVAHLDNNKSNSAPWTLAALCQVCPLHTQARLVMAQAYAFQHSPWLRWRVRAMELARATHPPSPLPG